MMAARSGHAGEAIAGMLKSAPIVTTDQLVDTLLLYRVQDEYRASQEERFTWPLQAQAYLRHLNDITGCGSDLPSVLEEIDLIPGHELFDLFRYREEMLLLRDLQLAASHAKVSIDIGPRPRSLLNYVDHLLSSGAVGKSHVVALCVPRAEMALTWQNAKQGLTPAVGAAYQAYLQLCDACVQAYSSFDQRATQVSTVSILGAIDVHVLSLPSGVIAMDAACQGVFSGIGMTADLVYSNAGVSFFDMELAPFCAKFAPSAPVHIITLTPIELVEMVVHAADLAKTCAVWDPVSDSASASRFDGALRQQVKLGYCDAQGKKKTGFLASRVNLLNPYGRVDHSGRLLSTDGYGLMFELIGEQAQVLSNGESVSFFARPTLELLAPTKSGLIHGFTHRLGASPCAYVSCFASDSVMNCYTLRGDANERVYGGFFLHDIAAAGAPTIKRKLMRRPCDLALIKRYMVELAIGEAEDLAKAAQGKKAYRELLAQKMTAVATRRLGMNLGDANLYAKDLSRSTEDRLSDTVNIAELALVNNAHILDSHVPVVETRIWLRKRNMRRREIVGCLESCLQSFMFLYARENVLKESTRQQPNFEDPYYGPHMLTATQRELERFLLGPPVRLSAGTGTFPLSGMLSATAASVLPVAPGPTVHSIVASPRFSAPTPSAPPLSGQTLGPASMHLGVTCARMLALNTSTMESHREALAKSAASNDYAVTGCTDNWEKFFDGSNWPIGTHATSVDVGHGRESPHIAAARLTTRVNLRSHAGILAERASNLYNAVNFAGGPFPKDLAVSMLNQRDIALMGVPSEERPSKLEECLPAEEAFALFRLLADLEHERAPEVADLAIATVRSYHDAGKFKRGWHGHHGRQWCCMAFGAIGDAETYDRTAIATAQRCIEICSFERGMVSRFACTLLAAHMGINATGPRVWIGGVSQLQHVDQDVLEYLAKHHTKPRPGQAYKDSAEVKAAFKQAKLLKSSEAWKRALEARRKARRGWEQARLQRAAQGDWGSFRECKPGGPVGWEVGYATAQVQDPHLTIHEHLEGVCQGPDIRMYPDTGCAGMAFTEEELQTALAGLKTAKSVGLDLTSAELLKGVVGGQAALVGIFQQGSGYEGDTAGLE